MLIAAANDGVAAEQYDAGNRAAFTFGIVFVTIGVAALSVTTYWLVWVLWRRVGLAVLLALMPAVAAVVTVPAWWNS